MTDRLEDLVGRVLLRVVYRHLESNLREADLAEQIHVFSGEVELQFEGATPLRVTWDENAGWPIHFSIATTTGTLFDEGVLTPLDASRSELWRPLINQTLTRVEVLSLGPVTPTAVLLEVGSRRVCITCGYGSDPLTIGDGDDLLVMSEEDARLRDRGLLRHVLWKRPE